MKTVATAPASVTYIARRASPTARSTPDSAMASENAILAGTAMARKRLATAAGSPLACSNRSSAGSRSSNMTIDRTVATMAAIARPEAARRRARCRSPAPSARDTVAEMAMVRPIETDSATNCNWLA